jgi:antitoxin CptB
MVSSGRGPARLPGNDDARRCHRYIGAAEAAGGAAQRLPLDQEFMLSDTEIRRRRLRFRAWHRGIREMDLLMGGFADAAIETLDDADLCCFEELMEVPDHDVFAWLTGQAPVPSDHDTSLFHKLKRFHEHAHPLNV